nr:MAG TPA: hypothetical protein [Caudoviricetes sp.]
MRTSGSEGTAIHHCIDQTISTSHFWEGYHFDYQ